jgi:hypothetical protein
VPGSKSRKPEEPPKRRRPGAVQPVRDASGEGSRSALARMLEQEKSRGATRTPRDDPDDEMSGPDR